MGMEAIHETLRIERPIDEVWRAWSDPRWLAGWHAERVDGELAVGRPIRLGWDSLGIALDLEVLAMDAPTRMVLRGFPPGRPPQTLSIGLAEAPGGATSLAIFHNGFASDAAGEEERTGTAAGWHIMARVLEHYLAHHAGRARACAAALAPATAALTDIEPLFARPSWLLADAAALDAEGDRFAGRTASGGQALGGAVLARALPRQIALAVDETAGVLVLRAIRLDTEPRGALLIGGIAWSWQPERAAYPALVAELEPAVGRLVAALGGGPGSATA